MSKEDDEYEEQERLSQLRYERNKPITPNCCEYTTKMNVIVMTVDDTYTEPRWYLNLKHTYDYLPDRWFDIKRPDLKCCPYCATTLPTFKLREVPVEPLMNVDMDSDYCGTCNERVMNCACFPLWLKWEPAY